MNLFHTKKIYWARVSADDEENSDWFDLHAPWSVYRPCREIDTDEQKTQSSKVRLLELWLSKRKIRTALQKKRVSLFCRKQNLFSDPYGPVHKTYAVMVQHNLLDRKSVAFYHIYEIIRENGRIFIG